MKDRLTALLNNWQMDVSVARVSELSIRIIYLVLLWSLVKSLNVASIVWGPDSLTLLYSPYTNFDRFAMILNVPEVREYYWMFLYPAIGILFAGLFGFHHYLSRLILWYLFLVLQFGNVETSTGGHHLMQQLLFFQIFLFKSNELEKWPSFRNLVHNLSFYSLWVQLAMLYLASGLFKLLGTYWLDGYAFLLSLSFKEFGMPMIADSLSENNWFFASLNYTVLVYQLLFAALIWIRPIRKPFLLIGLLFHLSIAFIVGLMDFGLFMVAAYSVFIQKDVADRIMKRIAQAIPFGIG
ncbi:MAG: HTTM domain-containing protein [Flavobacteriales bacterium]|jgi:hypothetical protein|nr:HTTM domain-containing protein [Flavobacteriales bacterium]MBT5183700.1 HTTM domain-containing protein [Euryarchaeota archaeon]MBT4704541.1 HTTM domain-containing protein [Flavobacteriales bacterium]MBT6133528.1 HTTM domain-containing protein [Flavobacteriales bacterium]MBT6915846.1 HTTM domain-containing protein [Flavobacteriales bacterium]